MATNLYILACAIVGILMVNQSVAHEHKGPEVWTDFSITDYIFKWHGEFIGSIHFDIPVEIDGWNLTLTFPKNIYDFEICPAEVLEIENRRIVHMTSHEWNEHIEEDGQLSMWFNARTWKKLRGIKAEAVFSGHIVPHRNETFNETESSESSESSDSRSDLSSQPGMDNGLQCRNEFNNVTCGSRIEIITKGTFNTIQMEIPVNFNQIEPNQIDIYTDAPVLFATAATYNHRFVSLDGEEIAIPDPQIEINPNDKRFMMVRLINLPYVRLVEAGRGIIYVQISFGGTSEVTFPYIADTPSCVCTRLKISGVGFTQP